MDKSIEQFIKLEDDALFGMIKEKTANMERRTWSPNVINPGCMTNPHCYHCKWECFKNEETMGKNRIPLDVVLKRAERQINAKVNRILLPSGWVGYNLPDYYFEYTHAIKKTFDIELFGLFGSINKNSLVSLKQAGMDGYQCGLESVNEKIYHSFRPGGDSLSDRLDTLKWAKEVGLKLWSGFIYGFGLEEADIVKSIKLLKELSVNSVCIMPFIPFPHTVFVKMAPANPYEWARIMAAAGLYLDDCDILCSEAQSPYSNYAGYAGVKWHPLFLA